uniref:Uncharacterized protein n=1 Tax=Trichobilharzia regenti TaxID=157069 RepID=A0AA85JQT6_TRIRE|nr:unnamed protein product [Trichobilharzia regenti]
MNSSGKDIHQIGNFQKSLDEYVEEKEKLKNQLSSAKAESSQLMDKIKSAKEEMKKIIEETEKIRMKKRVLIRMLRIAKDRQNKYQEELNSLQTNKEKTKNAITAKLESCLDERIGHLVECIKYSENHWLFRNLPNTDYSNDLEEQKTGGEEISPQEDH